MDEEIKTVNETEEAAEPETAPAEAEEAEEAVDAVEASLEVFELLPQAVSIIAARRPARIKEVSFFILESLLFLVYVLIIPFFLSSHKH